MTEEKEATVEKGDDNSKWVMGLIGTAVIGFVAGWTNSVNAGLKEITDLKITVVGIQRDLSSLSKQLSQTDESLKVLTMTLIENNRELRSERK